MLPGPRNLTKSLTREDWLRILLQYRRCDWSLRHPRERRGLKRDPICAFATLTFQSPERRGEHTVYRRCPVLEANAGGMSIRIARKLLPGTELHIELIIGDRRFGLSGKAMHSSGFPGNVRLGVKLDFTAAGG